MSTSEPIPMPSGTQQIKETGTDSPGRYHGCLSKSASNSGLHGEASSKGVRKTPSGRSLYAGKYSQTHEPAETEVMAGVDADMTLPSTHEEVPARKYHGCYEGSKSNHLSCSVQNGQPMAYRGRLGSF